jgi:NADPH:quinone reductase-like Zn-dependent oxidoreductase
MRGAIFYEHGPIDVIQVANDLPVPEPGPGEVRLKMKAAALNRLDLWVRVGWKGLSLKLPHINCADGAGIVDKVGAGVAAYTPGDRVCIDPTIVPPDSPSLLTGMENQTRIHILGEGIDGVGSEYAVVPARNLLKMPDQIDFRTAAAAGLVYLTAWHSLITRGGLRAGESVLIIGAGGGVNSASIEIAKLAGAKVYVVGSSAEKCAKAKELGADFTIDRQANPDWSRMMYQVTNKQGVDVVVDNVGVATISDSIRSTRIGGRLLIVGNTSGYNAQIDLRQIFSRQISIIGSTMGPHQDYIRVMTLVFEGRLKPAISAVLPLEKVKEAHRMLEESSFFGKIVLDVEA